MKRLIILAAAVLLIVFGIVWVSPTQVIKRRTNKLMSALTLEEGSGSAARHLNTLSFASLIAEDVTLEIEGVEEANGEFSRQDLNSGFSWFTTQVRSSNFKVTDFLNVGAGGDRAEVEAKVEAVVSLRDYRPADGAYLMELSWVKADGGWRLTRVKWREAR
jgi:hypothetical protein